MQTKKQWKKPKDWKVVTAVATTSALGLSGLALAGPDRTPEPESIDLIDRRSVDSVTNSSRVPTTVEQALSQVMDSVVSDQTSDSPLDSAPSAQSDPTTDSPSLQSPVSPEGSPASPQDSPASPQDSPDSPQASPDSPASVDSGSVDSGSADS